MLAAALLAAPITAQAIPILFDLTGQFESGSSLSGTITIDTATGLATAANVIIGAPASLTFGVIEAQGGAPGPGAYQIQIGDGGGLPDFNIVFPPISLIGYAGGDLCTSSNSGVCSPSSDIFYSFSPVTVDYLRVGTASVRSVAEPASFLLLDLSAAAALLARRRKAK